MKEPIRLRLDPEQAAGLRSALDAEIAAPLGHDLAMLKQGIGAQIAAGVSPASGAATTLKGLAVMLALGTGAAWWFSQPEPAVLTEAPQPTSAMTAPLVVAMPPPQAPLAEGSAEPAAQAAASELAPSPAARASTQASRPRPSAGASSAAPAADEAAPANEAAPASDLAAQMALYGDAQRALESQRWSDAEQRFTEYLQTYGQGSLVTEATLGRLEALHQAGRFADVSRSARAILNGGRMPSRQAEIHRVLAEAEVMQGRCAQAQAAYQRAQTLGAAVSDEDVQGALQACEGRAMR